MDVLELCIKATIRYLNGDYKEFNRYKKKALEIHKEIEFEEKCNYPIETLVPGEIKNKLIKMVS